MSWAQQQNFCVRVEDAGADLTSSRVGFAYGGAAANTESGAQQIGGSAFSTAFQWEAMILTVLRASAATDVAIDLGYYDVVGGVNFHPFVENLRLSSRKAAGDIGSSYYLPVRIPAGTSLRVRAQTATASATVDVGIIGFSQGLGGARGFARCECLTTLGTTRGTAIDPGASANTKPGTWTQLIASTARRYGALMVAIGANNDVARTAQASALLDLAIGGSGSERVILPNFPLCWTTTTDHPFPLIIPAFPCEVPAGSRVSARMQCSDATAGDRTIDVTLYGFAA